MLLEILIYYTFECEDFIFDTHFKKARFLNERHFCVSRRQSDDKIPYDGKVFTKTWCGGVKLKRKSYHLQGL